MHIVGLKATDMDLLAGKTVHHNEVRVWALVVLWSVVTVVAGYILWAKVAGF